MPIRIKSVLDKPTQDDGMRFLIEKVLPDSIFEEELRLFDWIRELAPPAEMKKLLDGAEDTWRTFRREYYQYLLDPSREMHLKTLTDYARTGQITLVYYAKHEYRNHATVLKTLLELRMHMDNEY